MAKLRQVGSDSEEDLISQPARPNVPVQTDARGVSYVIGPDGKPLYIAPTSTLANPDPNAKGSFFHNKDWNTGTGKYDSSLNWNSIISLATLGGIAGPAAYAAMAPAAVGPAAAASGLPADLAAVNGTLVGTAPAALSSVAAPAGAAAASPSVISQVGKHAMSAGSKIDTTKLLLGAMSLFGGDNDPFQKRTSFSGTGADPVKTLTSALEAIKGLGNHVSQTGPRQVKAPNLQRAEPMTIPGVPFQIGGGLGRDPAIRATDQPATPSQPQPYDLFNDSTGQAVPGQTKRRQP